MKRPWGHGVSLHASYSGKNKLNKHLGPFCFTAQMKADIYSERLVRDSGGAQPINVYILHNAQAFDADEEMELYTGVYKQYVQFFSTTTPI